LRSHDPDTSPGHLVTLETAGLCVVDVEELSTHGGSLRVHARPADAVPRHSPAQSSFFRENQASGAIDHTQTGADFTSFGRITDARRRVI
jgi:hypothetical protein